MPPRKKAKAFNYKSMIRSAARKIWMWSPERRLAIKNARVYPGHVGCAYCKKVMKENPKKPLKKAYRVDHIIPASEPAALIHDWNDFFVRMFVPASEQQVLCLECHALKTNDETKVRVKSRRTGRSNE